MKLDFDFYTISQAAHRLNIHADDVMQLLAQEKLTAYITLDQRQMILIESYPGNPRLRLARGVAYYSGLACLPLPETKSLIKEGQLILETPALLSPPYEVSAFVQEHGLSSEDFLKDHRLSWSPFDQDYLATVGTLYGLPYPNEFPAVQKTILSTIRQFASPEDKEAINLEQYRSHDYSFRPNGDFKLDDLRISHRELFNLQQQEKKLPQGLDRKRFNGLHDLVSKIILDEPKRNYRDILKIIAAEAQTAPRHFDIDEIIIGIEKTHIVWLTASGTRAYFQKDSMRSLVSKLKRELLK